MNDEAFLISQTETSLSDCNSNVNATSTNMAVDEKSSIQRSVNFRNKRNNSLSHTKTNIENFNFSFKTRSKLNLLKKCDENYNKIKDFFKINGFECLEDNFKQNQLLNYLQNMYGISSDDINDANSATSIVDSDENICSVNNKHQKLRDFKSLSMDEALLNNKEFFLELIELIAPMIHKEITINNSSK